MTERPTSGGTAELRRLLDRSSASPADDALLRWDPVTSPMDASRIVAARA
ncbi:MAG TPA: hypothetical protein VFY16_04195 [Gemmatimonadaceae bacterium]|nr:hypothetical protein [Gemmatimonadaceae bacterium]